ncbi:MULTISPECIES: S66 peptidase family protein [unclassified Pseudoalteromonas]|uniref:S66 family peptidase n=1 Tax=unclassified Pseudoalteromonas TaxID=194690 RepID=UPI00209751BF|nr:S66 peptidase family protein [Pseudoalteromonas sp. XMcav2-N]MCO7189019.1 LD-carboxypeptidase [Pseudoalteromonas sp. XMcav2-N]
MYYPAPLTSGSTIAVTAFSSGVPTPLHARLDRVLQDLVLRGFKVLEGQCLRDDQLHVSAPVAQRVEELMRFLMDDQVDAIMAPWGGEIAMDLLPLLDWEALQHARPKWLMGFSDISTVLSAFTSKLGWATCHCTNLMQLSLAQSDPLTANTFKHLYTASGGSFTQIPAPFFEQGYSNYAQDSEAVFNLTEQSGWQRINHDEQLDGSVSFSGRLLGGCLDTHMLMFGSEYFDPQRLLDRHPDDKLIFYFENAEQSPTGYYRALQSLKLRGAFEHAAGILIGRNAVSGSAGKAFDGETAVKMALEDLTIPVVTGVDVSHIAPNLVMINGALAEVSCTGEQWALVQHLR